MLMSWSRVIALSVPVRNQAKAALGRRHGEYNQLVCPCFLRCSFHHIQTSCLPSFALSLTHFLPHALDSFIHSFLPAFFLLPSPSFLSLFHPCWLTCCFASFFPHSSMFIQYFFHSSFLPFSCFASFSPSFSSCLLFHLLSFYIGLVHAFPSFVLLPPVFPSFFPHA